MIVQCKKTSVNLILDLSIKFAVTVHNP